MFLERNGRSRRMTRWFTFAHLPFGVYRLTIEHSGFQKYSTSIDVRTALPREVTAQMSIEAISAEVSVTETPTVLDAHRAGVVYSVGRREVSSIW